jgi:hypothetical protein
MMLPATGGNISGTPVVKQLSVPSSHFFGCLQYPEIFLPLKQTYFFGPETIQQRASCDLEHCHGGELNSWAEV